MNSHFLQKEGTRRVRDKKRTAPNPFDLSLTLHPSYIYTLVFSLRTLHLFCLSVHFLLLPKVSQRPDYSTQIKQGSHQCRSSHHCTTILSWEDHHVVTKMDSKRGHGHLKKTRNLLIIFRSMAMETGEHFQRMLVS